jgi:hypothetical protein
LSRFGLLVAGLGGYGTAVCIMLIGGACANMVILSKVRFDSCHSVPVLAAAAGWFRAGFSCLPRSSKH